MSVAVTIIAALLLIWEPLGFAARALQVWPTLGYRGWTAVAELAAQGLIAVLCVAAGMMLLNGAPDARRMARLAILMSGARVVVSLYWSALPNDTVPGDEPFYAALAIAIGAVAFIALRQRPTRSAPPSR